MELLTAINICVQWGAGSRPYDDPDLAPQAVLDAISLTKRKILQGSLTVNTDQFDLKRDNANQIKIPIEFIAVSLPAPYTIRNRFIYNTETRTNILTEDFDNTLVALDVDFSELPHSAANYIAWGACRAYSAQSRGPGNPRFAYADEEFATAEVEYYQENPATIHNDSPFATWDTTPSNCTWCWCWS